jgi:hypothetical protein
MNTSTFVSVISIASCLIASGCGEGSTDVTSPSALHGSTSIVPPTVPPDQVSCIAANAQWAIGSTATDELLEKARLAANAAVARFVMVGEPFTTEYLAARLNLDVDERRRVVAARCG